MYNCSNGINSVVLLICFSMVIVCPDDEQLLVQNMSKIN